MKISKVVQILEYSGNLKRKLQEFLKKSRKFQNSTEFLKKRKKRKEPKLLKLLRIP